MPPNQAPPSSSIYESSSFVDFGDIFVDIMEECRPFYSLANADKRFDCQNSIQPRLEDALKGNKTPEKQGNRTVSFMLLLPDFV